MNKEDPRLIELKIKIEEYKNKRKNPNYKPSAGKMIEYFEKAIEIIEELLR